MITLLEERRGVRNFRHFTICNMCLGIIAEGEQFVTPDHTTHLHLHLTPYTARCGIMSCAERWWRYHGLERHSMEEVIPLALSD